MRAANVTSKHLAQYVDQRQQQDAANATINREMAALKRMFSLGYKATPKKVLYMPAFPHLKENNARTGFLEDAQYEKLIEGAELWFRALVECGATIGWRHHELLSLRVGQVDIEHRVLRLEPGTTKNDEGREAPMTDTMLQLLTACVEGKGADDHVFTRPDGSVVFDFRVTWQESLSPCRTAGSAVPRPAQDRGPQPAPCRHSRIHDQADRRLENHQRLPSLRHRQPSGHGKRNPPVRRASAQTCPSPCR
jgi:integrase